MRLPDWEHRLSELIRSRASKTFAWGDHDCVVFGADDCVAVVGVDPIAHLRGTWDSEESANAIFGGRSLMHMTRELLGPPRLHKFNIKRGDVGICVGTTEVVGVCVGEFMVAPSKVGLYRIELSTLVASWSIGSGDA